MTERRDEILGIAEELLLVRGFNGFSFQDIAERLGIKKPSLYHHFASKEDLGIALCDRFEAKYDAIANTGTTARERLEALFAFGAQLVELGDRCCPGGILQAEYQSYPERMRARVDALFAAGHEKLSALLEAGRTAGELDFEGEAGEAAWLVMSTQQGAVLQGRVHGPDVYRAVMRQLVSSLSA